MFTGIITDVGEVKKASREGDCLRLEISCGYELDAIDIGASIACNGVCLTVTKKQDGKLFFDLSPETVDNTTYKDVETGDQINLEQSLAVGDKLGGHFVTGHVDEVASVRNIDILGENWVVEFSVSDKIKSFIAKKGSITINGVSLTVNEVDGNKFTVNIIPHTLENTNLKFLEKNSKINIEIDILSRYINRYNDTQN